MALEKLTSHEIAFALAALRGWAIAREGAAIAKSFHFADFSEAFAFVTQIALAAEAMTHHPEWTNVYGRVDIVLTTHDSGGVTQLDLQLAGRIETIIALRKS